MKLKQTVSILSAILAALAMVFAFATCGGGGGSDDPNVITVTGLEGKSGAAGIMVTNQSAFDSVPADAALGTGTISGDSVTFTLKKADGSGWTDKGQYYLVLTIGDTAYVFTNGSSAEDLYDNETTYEAFAAKVPKFNITGADTVDFDKFIGSETLLTFLAGKGITPPQDPSAKTVYMLALYDSLNSGSGHTGGGGSNFNVKGSDGSDLALDFLYTKGPKGFVRFYFEVTDFEAGETLGTVNPDGTTNIGPNLVYSSANKVDNFYFADCKLEDISGTGRNYIEYRNLPSGAKLVKFEVYTEAKPNVVPNVEFDSATGKTLLFKSSGNTDERWIQEQADGDPSGEAMRTAKVSDTLLVRLTASAAATSFNAVNFIWHIEWDNSTTAKSYQTFVVPDPQEKTGDFYIADFKSIKNGDKVTFKLNLGDLQGVVDDLGEITCIYIKFPGYAGSDDANYPEMKLLSN